MYNSNVHKLTASLDLLNRKRLALLESMASLPPDILARQPGPKRWSLLQVLQHLVIAERDVLQGLPEPSRLVHQKRNPLNYINYAIVLLILKWGIPVPVPSAEMVPDGDATFQELCDQWDRNVDWFKSYIDGLNATTAGLAVFKHPVTGPLTCAQALHIGRLHLENHIRHINRIQRLLEMQKA